MGTFKARMWLLVLVGLLGLFLVVNFLPAYSDQGVVEWPINRTIFPVLIFYLFFWLAGTGIFTLLLLWFQGKIRSEREVADKVLLCLRQGALLSLMLVILLVLQSFRVLVWWDGLLAMGAVLMVELYFLSR